MSNDLRSTADKQRAKIERINQQLQVIAQDSEIASVLYSAVILEENLRSMIQSFMVEMERPRNPPKGDPFTTLFGGSNCVLGTFSSKISLAFALGLVSDDERNDLFYVKEIRNLFAHNWENVSFDMPNIIAYVANLRHGFAGQVDESKATTKEMFFHSVQGLILSQVMRDDLLVFERRIIRKRSYAFLRQKYMVSGDPPAAPIPPTTESA